MTHDIDERLLGSLAKEVERFPPTVPSGHMARQISERGFYDEQDLRFSADDFHLGIHFAGLAVLARDMQAHLAQHPRSDTRLFDEVISAVHSEESRAHGARAFPAYAGLPAQSLPVGMAAAADAGQPDVTALGDRAIVHEWTFKPGKRLFVKFGDKLKESICGKDGPYEQFNNGLVGKANLPTTVASAILLSGLSTATFWYPLAVYLGVIFVKAGLKTYCE